MPQRKPSTAARKTTARKRTKKKSPAAKTAPRKPSARGAAAIRMLAAAGPAGGDTGPGSGLPEAPRSRLSLPDTKRRVKIIIGGQSGQNPATITDESPVRRPNILLTRLLVALNRHFFPSPLDGIVGFPPGETVGDLAERIKLTRDPQLP